jgi:hypothetical protein
MYNQTSHPQQTIAYKYISITIRCQPYILDTLQKRFSKRVYFIAKEQNYIKINFIFGPKVSYMEQYSAPIFMEL